MKIKQPDIPKELKEFYQQCNRVRALISLKKLRTVKEVCKDTLGREPPNGYNLGDVINLKIFNEIFKIYENRFFFDWKPLEEICKACEENCIYNDRIQEQERRKSISESVESISETEVNIPLLNPKQKCKLYKFQQRCAEEIFKDIVSGVFHGGLLRVNTGDGKTYGYGQVIRWLIDIDWFKDKTISPYKITVITKASVIEQTTRDLEDEFGLELYKDFWIFNYDALRSSFGKIFIEESTIVEDGETHTKYKWKPLIHPKLIILDEYQSVKNLQSKQSKVIQELANLDVKILSSSATPASRVSALKVFAVSCKKQFTVGGATLTLNNDNFLDYSKRILKDIDPFSYSRVGMKRFLKEFKENIYTYKNVYRKYRDRRILELLDFDCQEDSIAYYSALEEFQRQKAKFENLGNSYIHILTQFLIFRMKAAMIRTKYIARRMHSHVENGYAAIYAGNFKGAIAKSVKILNETYKVPREKISIIWGGTNLHGEEITDVEIKAFLKKAYEGQATDPKELKKVLSALKRKDSGLIDLPKDLDLGIQDRNKRQIEIDKFQSGKSLYCFFTFGAGGAGLSLHHRYDYLRPRRCDLEPTYNEMEMQQGFGRAHRINSLSETIQSILCYRGTIEESVISRMNQKKGCLDVLCKFNEENSLVDSIINIMADEEDEELNEKDFQEIENENQQ